MALGTSKAKAPTKGLSKLNSMAFGLAVYASQDGSPRHHARLASGRWSGVTARAFHPQGSYERFQSCILTSHPPFPSFAWHNEVDRRQLSNAVSNGGLVHRRTKRQSPILPRNRGTGPPGEVLIALKVQRSFCHERASDSRFQTDEGATDAPTGNAPTCASRTSEQVAQMTGVVFPTA